MIRSVRGFTYHDPAYASHEEVLANYYLNGAKSSGVAFARKLHCAGQSLPGKDSARSRLVNLYDTDKWPMELRILTMPGLKWLFERQLLQRRGQLQTKNMRRLPKFLRGRTFITAIENDELIYRAALKYIPRHNGAPFTVVSGRAIKTSLVRRYIAMAMEEYIEHPLCPEFDVAWLDFTGFLTQRRLEGINNFWRTRCGLHLTVTTLAARWAIEMTKRINKAGGLGMLIAGTLDAKVLNEFTYADMGMPMHQITLVKNTPDMRYFGYDPYPTQTIERFMRSEGV